MADNEKKKAKLQLHHLKPAPGSKKKGIRVGRGEGGRRPYRHEHTEHRQDVRVQPDPGNERKDPQHDLVEIAAEAGLEHATARRPAA